MKSRLYFAVMVLAVFGILFLSYKIPEERFKWEDERQIKNLSESDENEVSFQEKEELSLIDKFHIIYPNEDDASSVPIVMPISDEEKEELEKKGKSILEELMVSLILVRDDNYEMENVEKKLYMEVTDSVNIVILYSFIFSDLEGNIVMVDMEGDTGKVMGFMEKRKNLDIDIEKKAKKYVDYLGGSYIGLEEQYYYDDLMKKLVFQIEGQSIEYFIIANSYVPYYRFGMVYIDYGYYDRNGIDID